MSEVSARKASFLFTPQPDSRLVRMAGELGGTIATDDANLRKAAERQGVPVISVKELATALQPGPRPGDDITVKIVKAGKEPEQGIAYLDDDPVIGTMVVVERARRYIGSEVTIKLDSVLYTTAGRMLFANLDG
jgi:uncharacterized protein YacL